MHIFRFIFLSAFLAMACLSVCAQIRIVPREELDARMNPALSADSSLLHFDTRHIVADPMNEDSSPMKFRYVVSNKGNRPVQLKRLVSTCSCAAAVCDRRQIGPGESAVITVTYNPKGHPGRFERRIFVYTGDGNSPAAILRLNVNVGDSGDYSGIYRKKKGVVRLRRDTVAFKAGGKAVEKIPFVNLSGKDLRLECDREMLPGCLSFSTRPEVVKDREEGEIVIAFDPERGKVRDMMTIILKGIGEMPGRSSIIVTVDSNENR